jgi:hypothetical protein
VRTALGGGDQGVKYCAIHVGENTSSEKSSSGAASTTLMVNLLLGWTVAKPLETVREITEIRNEYNGCFLPTKPFFGTPSGLDDFNDTRAESFD